MLKIIEPYFISIEAARTTAQLHDVLETIADEFGFRSGLLIEFRDPAAYEPLLLDTNPDRYEWWDNHCSGFLASMSAGIRHRLLTESLIVLKQDHEADRPPQEAVLRRQLDLNELTLVPIPVGETVAGCIGFSGTLDLSSTQVNALKGISLMLFAQCRFVRTLN